MISRTLTKSLLALTATALSFSVLATPGDTTKPEAREARGGGGGWMLQRLDADGDGAISLQEFQAAGEARFARLDANGDGYVSRAEFDDARMARFSALDTNGNGVIDADELPRHKGQSHRKGKGDGQRYGACDGSGKRGR